MNAIERVAYLIGRMRGQTAKGLEDVFRTSGARADVSDATAWIDLEEWGMGLLEGRKAKTKKQFINQFTGFVYICAKLNYQTVASQRLRLYVAKKERTQKFVTIKTRPLARRQKDWIYSRPQLDPWLTKAAEIEEVTEHVWLETLRNVNPQHNRRDLIEYTVMFSDLTGECYWLLLKSGLGVPEAIWPVPSQFINPVFGDNLQEPITGYVYESGNVRVEIPEDMIVYFTYPNPKNLFKGFGCVQGVAQAVYTRDQMDAFETALFENRARVGGVITEKERISKVARDRLKEQFDQEHVGSKKAGKRLWLPLGLEWQKDAMTPEEISYIKGRRMNMEEICLALDIPPGALTSENVNLANAQMADLRHAKNGILPRCDRITEKMNEKILPLYDDKLFCEFDNPVPQDRKLILAEQAGRVKAGIMTINEVRAEEGLEPVEGGDVPYVDSRLVPLGSSPEEQAEEFGKRVIKHIKEIIDDWEEDEEMDIMQPVVEKFGTRKND